MSSLKFKWRSSKLELLDDPMLPSADLFRNLTELHLINRLLGGYKVLLKGLKILLSDSKTATVRILDLGSGCGDSLAVLHKMLYPKYRLELTGVDLKSDCIRYAKHRHKQYQINFIESNYRDLIMQESNSPFDIITASLFCHHLTDEDLVELLIWLHQNARLGFVINDLHRHWFAYYAIKGLTKLFSKSYLVKHDAPLSVLRGFQKKELQALLKKAGIQKYHIQWCWAFRWLIVKRI